MSISESTKVFKGLGSQTLITILSGIFGIANFAIMSRLLTRETFGYFAIITAVMVVINEVNNAGMGSAVIQRKNIDDDFYNTAFSISVITGAIFSLLVFVLSSFLSELFTKSSRLEDAFKMVSITLLLNNISSVLRAQYMRKLQFFKFGTFQMIATILSYGLGISMALCGFQLSAIVAASVSNSIFIALILLFLSKNTLRIKIEKKYIKEIVSYGGWLTAAGLVRSVYEQIDKLLTTRWLSISLLGAYNRPNGFVFQISSTVNGIFDTTLFPILSGIQDDKQKILSAYEKSMELTCIFSTLMAYVMILSAHFLTIFFLGNEWIDLVPIFQIASFTIIFLFCGRIGDSFFRSTGYVKEYFYIRVAACCMSIVCVYIGCKFGIVGLAIGVMISRLFDVMLKMMVLGDKLSVSTQLLLIRIFKDLLIPTIYFAFCLLFTLYFGKTYITGIMLLFFVALIIITIYCKPRIFGKVFCDCVFCPLQQRLKCFKK